MFSITPELVLRAYASGYFPMARGREDPEIEWFGPENRGVLPLESFHVPRSLFKVLRQDTFQVRCDTAFDEVMRKCAEPMANRHETWINDEILSLYQELHRRGHAHSVETWQGGQLVGGLYGVSIGGAFFGESMFSRATNASKVALCHLVARMKVCGYSLLDTQFITAHLAQFGAIEIPRSDYMKRLATAIVQRVGSLTGVSVSEVLRHSTSHKS